MLRFARIARALAVGGLVSVIGCNPLKPPPELQFDPGLMRSPPEPLEVSIEVLPAPVPEGNARLRVRFKEKMERKTLVIEGGAGPTLLREDGDGVFSAFVHFDAKPYEAELERRARAASRVREVPVFKNRMLVGTERIEADRVLFEAGKIVPIKGYRGFPWLVDPKRELLINDVSVVDDPARTYDPCTGVGTQMGPWTFGKLMTEMANEPATGINASDFTLHWLQQWSADRVINGFTVTNRATGVNNVIINPWPKLANGKLDLAQAPFRLLAIVNRIDLRGSTAYGSGNAGEARMVFGLISCNPVGPQKAAEPFTVIFEYGIPKRSCAAIAAWAQQWRALGSLLLTTSAYNAALQAITDQFTLRDADFTKPPNRSALNQLRTNEFAIAPFFADTFWELREFRICGDGSACGLGQLEETTVAQTPDRSFQSQPALRDFINSNQSAILAGTDTVPLQLPSSTPFRAGAIQPGAGFPWNAAGITSLDAREAFSLATCSGCHTVETGTSFLHIAPRTAGNASKLSDFITGANMPKTDPVSGVPRTFNALLDRQASLDAAATMTCRPNLSFPVEELFPRFGPPEFVH